MYRKPVFAVPCEEILFASYCQARAVFYRYDTSSFATDMKLAMRPVAKTLFVIFFLLFGGCAGEGSLDSKQDEIPARGSDSPGFVPAFASAQSPVEKEEAIEAWLKIIEGKKIEEIVDMHFTRWGGIIFKLSLIAEHYRAQGRLAKAEPIYKHLLAITEKGWGADSSSAAVHANDLAELYYDQGRYAEAETLYERALAIRENA